MTTETCANSINPELGERCRRLHSPTKAETTDPRNRYFLLGKGPFADRTSPLRPISEAVAHDVRKLMENFSFWRINHLLQWRESIYASNGEEAYPIELFKAHRDFEDGTYLHSFFWYYDDPFKLVRQDLEKLPEPLPVQKQWFDDAEEHVKFLLQVNHN
jgi:hypothetical protein